MTIPRIVVINPNSDNAVTVGLRRALAHFTSLPVQIDCLTLEGAPKGIETAADIQVLERLLPAKVAELSADANAIVLACYSDPLIDSCRQITSVPVFGIQSASVLTALACGKKFGVCALSDISIERHQHYLKRLGLLTACVGELPLDIHVADTLNPEIVRSRLWDVGQQLIAKGAEALILGCAGLSAHRAWLSQQLAVHVIDPTQAAVGQALAALMRDGTYL